MFDFSKNYLYHSSYKLEEILKSGFILSRNNIGDYKSLVDLMQMILFHYQK